MNKIFKVFQSETKAEEAAGKRTLVALITTPDEDRSHDHVNPKGVQLDNYSNNPVVTWAHNYDELPIAKCISLKVSDSGILATVEFPPEGTYEKSDIVYWMYKNKFLNTWSIGFMPTDYDANEDGGYDFKAWEMFEFASVPVPDNPKAITVMRSKGLEVDSAFDRMIAKGIDVEKPAAEEKKVEEKQVAEEPAEKKATEEEFIEYKMHPTDDTETQAVATEKAKAAATEDDDSESDSIPDTMPVTDLNVGQLRSLLDEAEEGEDDDDSKAVSGAVLKEVVINGVKKDVHEVVALSYIIGDLSWFIQCFTEEGINEADLEKMSQALQLLLDVVQSQAEIGKKSFTVGKAGRAISGKHEDMLTGAVSHMNEAVKTVQSVLDSVADDAGQTPSSEVVIDQTDVPKDVAQSDFLTKLANSLKTNNQKQDVMLRLLRNAKSREGGDK